jgi:sugar-specific transcriptional regulator TrmB
LDSSNLIKLFTDYGLTRNQAKVLSTLTQNKSCLTAKQISQQSNIARESIYLILPNLTKKGLVQNTISKPKKFSAIPLKSTLSLLYEQKNNQIHELAKLTTQILMEYDQNSKINQLEEKSQFILIPRKKQLVNKISNAIIKSKKTVRIITSWKRHLKSMIVYKTALKTALSNGVKIQVLVTERFEKDQLPKSAKIFYDHPNSLIKSVDSPAKIIELIIDDHEIFLMTDPKADLVESSALWSNNKSLITALTTCFDAVCKIS